MSHGANGKITYVDGFPMKVDEGVARMGPKGPQDSKIQDVVSRVTADSFDSLFCDPEPTLPFASPTSGTSADFPTASQEEATRQARARLVRYFRHYDPSQVSTVDTLLEENQNKEEQLLQSLVATYGIEPPATANPYQERLTRYFKCYHLSLSQLAIQLDDYAGKEEELISMLVGMHGPEPVEQPPPVEVNPVHRKRLTRFYEKYNPAKLPMVDDMLRNVVEHDDGVQHLFEKLVEKYGAEPAEDEVIEVRQRAVSRMQGKRDSHTSWRKSLPAPSSPFDTAVHYSPLKQRLTRFYLHYNPEKLEDVDKVAKTYKGKETLLFQKLVAKYGPEPEDTEKSMKVDEDTRGDYFACLASSSPKKSLIRLGSMSSPEIRSSASPRRPSRRVRARVLDDVEHVKSLVKANPKLPAWDEDYKKWVGKVGYVIREKKEDGIVGMVFDDHKGGWFPKSAITPIKDEDRRETGSEEPKRDSLASIGSILTSPDGRVNGSFSAVLDNASIASLSPKGSFVKQTTPVTEGKDKQVYPSKEEKQQETEGSDGGQEGTVENEESEEKEDEKEETTTPEKYVIKSKDYAAEYSGTYVRVEGGEVNGHPLWKREKGEDVSWLFSTPDGLWRVTDDKADFETGDGYFNTEAHEGRLPHRAGDWLNADDCVDKNISCTPHDASAGDRVLGGHVVVGRVCAELTEEELQYASFQRRRRFKPKKEVPISGKCAACKKFEAVCSKCYMSHRKAQRERREYLKEKYASWDLRRRVGVFFSAVVEGEDDDVKVMLEAGANANWLAFFKKRSQEVNNLPEGGCGVTPLHVACAYAQPDVACTLIGAGARYRRDQTNMFPTDYLPDNEDVVHDITMFLEEKSAEYTIAQQVQEAWDLYNDHDFESARDTFFSLLMQYPNRDTCHLGLIYCHYALGDIAACLHQGRESLNAKDIEWVECQALAVKKEMDKANDLMHEQAHAEETEGCVKRCGCVVYPQGWTVPLRKLRKMRFGLMRQIFEYLPSSDAFNTWLAVHRSELLRTAVDRHVTAASRLDKHDALSIFARVPAWLASFKEAVIDQAFDAWDAKHGELAHVSVDGIECECIPTFPHFMLKVTVAQKYVAQTAFSKIRGWWGEKSKPKRSASKVPTAHSCTTFTLKLPSHDSGLGFDITVQTTGFNEGKVRIVGIRPGSPACKGGLLPGTVVSVDGKEAGNMQSFQAAIDQFKASKKLQLTLGVHVEVHEGSWVEAARLVKMSQLNGVQGYVTGVAVGGCETGESVVTVNFRDHGLVRLKPSNLVFSMEKGGEEEDCASVGSPSTAAPSLAASRVRSSHSAFGDTVRSATSAAPSDGSTGDFPLPIPPRRSRNEIYEKFKREKVRLSIRTDTLIFASHIVFSDPAAAHQLPWVEWRLKLQHTPSL